MEVGFESSEVFVGVWMYGFGGGYDGDITNQIELGVRGVSLGLCA